MDEKKLVRQIIARCKQLEQERVAWESVWEEILEYVQPFYKLSVQKNQSLIGDVKALKAYSGVPIHAAQFFANGLQGYLVSPNMAWFKNTMESDLVKDSYDVKEWLDEIDKIMYAAFQKTNFYSSMNELFLFGGSICTSTIMVEEDIRKDRLCYSVRHPYEVYIDVDKYNQVDTNYRRFKIPARIAVQEFGYKNLPKSIQKAATDQADTKFEFIHAIEPRNEREPWKLDSKNKPVASYYVSVTDEKLISEGGYDIMPSATWRPMKSMICKYGGGPGTDALVDIRGANIVAKDLLHAANLAVNPPYQAHASMEGKIRIYPNGMTYYERDDQLIRPVVQDINFPIGVDREQKIEDSIKKHFAVDFFIMLENAERQMTATEIVERQGEKAAMLGPLIGNLNNDVLNPIFDIVFSKLVAAGKIPPPPPILTDERFRGKDVIKIDYMGPLAQAQKKTFQGSGLIRSLETFIPLLDIRPELGDILNWQEYGKAVLEWQGLPAKLINRPDVIEKMKQLREQAIAQQQAQEAMGVVADAASKTNRRTEPGSMLEQVQKQMTGGRR